MRWTDVYKPPAGPDRVERLLTSCRSYYRDGDRDIALLLLKEIQKELSQEPLFPPAAAARSGETREFLPTPAEGSI